MRLTANYWIKYVNTHTSANKTAERLMERYIAANGIEDMEKVTDYAYALVSKYGEAASALSCEMYDQLARAQRVNVPEALPAETASYGEVAKAVRGAGKRSPSLIPDAVGRLVKQAGADTTLQNAKRDGAYFAWVSHGDTCPYCMALAALGWRKAGKMTLEGGHAEHIHANCDCEYAIDLKGDLEIDGYDPNEINQRLLDMTDGEFDAEDLIRRSGHNAKGHDHGALNIVRRKQYAANKNHINAQKRAAYTDRTIRETIKELEKEADKWIKELSKEEIDSIQKYAYNPGDVSPNRFFEKINAMLRGDAKENSKLRQHADNISSGLHKFKIEKDFYVYRRVDHDPTKGIKKGDIIAGEQFLSTSVDPRKALKKDYLIKIRIKRGTVAAYIDSLSVFDQTELLIDKDVLYRVKSISEQETLWEVIV